VPKVEEDIGTIRFSGALRVASVFRAASFLTLLGAALTALATGINLAQQTDTFGNHVNSGGSVAAFVAVELFGGVLAASFLAFFAYVLEILVDIYSQMWELRNAVEPLDDDDEDQPADRGGGSVSRDIFDRPE
jgi:hypothetical protein